MTAFAGIVIIVVLLCPGAGFGEEGDFSPDSEEVIHQTGVIDRIEMNDIVINDVLYKLIPETLYQSSSGESIPKDWFRKGMTVGFSRNKEQQILLLAFAE